MMIFHFDDGKKNEDVVVSETNAQGMSRVKGLLLLSSSHKPGGAFLDVQP